MTVQFSASQPGVHSYLCHLHPPHLGGQMLVLSEWGHAGTPDARWDRGWRQGGAGALARAARAAAANILPAAPDTMLAPSRRSAGTTLHECWTLSS